MLEHQVAVKNKVLHALLDTQKFVGIEADKHSVTYRRVISRETSCRTDWLQIIFGPPTTPAVKVIIKSDNDCVREYPNTPGNRNEKLWHSERYIDLVTSADYIQFAQATLL